MTAHLFVVSNETFNFHLAYGFAGIGSREDTIELFDESSPINTRTRVLSSLACDISKISIGDSIFFYLQSNGPSSGQFFGEFCASSTAYSVQEGSELDGARLTKSLPLRIDIKPKRVFPIGIKESTFLDRITNPSDGEVLKANEIPWSLIYRKLLGNRGCSPMKDSEANFLRKYLENVNDKPLQCKNLLQFDLQERNIFESDIPDVSPSSKTSVKRFEINLEALYFIARNQQKSAEVFLQWLLLNNAAQSQKVWHPVLESRAITWIGNEVGCGMGARKIDILMEVEGATPDLRRLLIIELKDDSPKIEHAAQLTKYVQWAIDHYLTTSRYESIQPILITTKRSRNPATSDLTFTENFVRGRQDFSSYIQPIKHFVTNDDRTGTPHFLETAETP